METMNNKQQKIELNKGRKMWGNFEEKKTENKYIRYTPCLECRARKKIWT